MFTVIFFILRNHKVNTFYSVLSMALGAWIAIVSWHARPGMCTCLFVTLLMLLFHLGEKKNVKYLWLIPVVFLLWANMHIGFTFGILLLAMFLAYQTGAYLFLKTDNNLSFLKNLLTF